MRASVDSGPTSCRAAVDIMKINHLSYHRDTETTRLKAEAPFFFTVSTRCNTQVRVKISPSM